MDPILAKELVGWSPHIQDLAIAMYFVKVHYSPAIEREKWCCENIGENASGYLATVSKEEKGKWLRVGINRWEFFGFVDKKSAMLFKLIWC